MRYEDEIGGFMALDKRFFSREAAYPPGGGQVSSMGLTKGGQNRVSNLKKVLIKDELF